jgi:hypothetical protein
MVLQFVGEYVVAFLRKTLHENEGFFVFIGATCSAKASVRRLFKKSLSEMTGFLF